MVELRKRKAPAPPPVVKKSKSALPKPDNANSTSQTDAPKVPQVDDVLDLENFGGEIETNDGSKTSLKKLVESSTSGVVLFTYPKASTPGCMCSPPIDSIGVQRPSYTSPQAPSKSACFVIITPISHQLACRFMVFPPIHPKPTPLSKRSRAYPTLSFAIPMPI